jgi:hypothetical protein
LAFRFGNSMFGTCNFIDSVQITVARSWCWRPWWVLWRAGALGIWYKITYADLTGSDGNPDIITSRWDQKPKSWRFKSDTPYNSEEVKHYTVRGQW